MTNTHTWTGERRQLVAYLFFAAIGAAPFIPTPCAGATYDDLPSGTPKGYIEFYAGPLVTLNMIDNLGFGSGGKTWEIWKKETGEPKRVATMRIGFHTERCRIAERPGKHTYFVKSARPVIGGASVYVYVKERSVTPVEIDLLSQTEFFVKHYYLSAFVKMPIPVAGGATNHAPLAGGYSDEQLGPNVFSFSIGYSPTIFASSQRRQDLYLLHAADLTLSQGFNYFAIVWAWRLGDSVDTTIHCFSERPSSVGKIAVIGMEWPLTEQIKSGYVFDARLLSKSLGAKYKVKP